MRVLPEKKEKKRAEDTQSPSRPDGPRHARASSSPPPSGHQSSPVRAPLLPPRKESELLGAACSEMDIREGRREAPATAAPARHDGGGGDRARMGADGFPQRRRDSPRRLLCPGPALEKEGVRGAGPLPGYGPRPLSGPASCLRRPRRCLKTGSPGGPCGREPRPAWEAAQEFGSPRNIKK